MVESAREFHDVIAPPATICARADQSIMSSRATESKGRMTPPSAEDLNVHYIC